MVFAIFQIRDNICLNQVRENRNEEDKAPSIDIPKIELTALKDPTWKMKGKCEG